MNVVEVQAAECLSAQVFRCAGHSNAATEFWMRFLGAAAIKFGNDVAREGLREIIGRGGSRASVAPFLGSTKWCVLALKWPRNEGLVAAATLRRKVTDGTILPLPSEFHVVDAVGVSLNMAKHHGGRSVHPQFVRHVHGGEPRFSGAFTETNLGTHGRRKDLTTAARDAVKTSVLQLAHDSTHLGFVGISRRIKEVHKLHELRRAECMDVNVRKASLDFAQQLQVPAQRQLWVHAALHENLRATDGYQLFNLVKNGFVGQRVRIVIFCVAAECAEGALGSTDIRVVDVAIDDVGANMVTVYLAATEVGPHAKIGEWHIAQDVQALFWTEASGTCNDGIHEGSVSQRVDGGVHGWSRARGSHGSQIVGRRRIAALTP